MLEAVQYRYTGGSLNFLFALGAHTAGPNGLLQETVESTARCTHIMRAGSLHQFAFPRMNYGDIG